MWKLYRLIRNKASVSHQFKLTTRGSERGGCKSHPVSESHPAIADQECVDHPRGKRVEARLCSVRPCHLRSFCSVHQSSAKAGASYPYHLQGLCMGSVEKQLDDDPCNPNHSNTAVSISEPARSTWEKAEESQTRGRAPAHPQGRNEETCWRYSKSLRLKRPRP